MDIKFWTPVLVSVVFAIGSVQAMADSNWSYDESTDTITYGFSGSPVTQSSSQDEVTRHTGAWYYDESTDTIVSNSEGSRSKYVRSNPSDPEPAFDFELAFLDQ